MMIRQSVSLSTPNKYISLLPEALAQTLLEISHLHVRFYNIEKVGTNLVVLNVDVYVFGLELLHKVPELLYVPFEKETEVEETRLLLDSLQKKFALVRSC